MKDEKVKKNRQRYNLHYRVRKQGYTLKSRKKTIYVPYDELTFTAHVQILRQRFGYVIQTEIR